MGETTASYNLGGRNVFYGLHYSVVSFPMYFPSLHAHTKEDVLPKKHKHWRWEVSQNLSIYIQLGYLSVGPALVDRSC